MGKKDRGANGNHKLRPPSLYRRALIHFTRRLNPRDRAQTNNKPAPPQFSASSSSSSTSANTGLGWFTFQAGCSAVVWTCRRREWGKNDAATPETDWVSRRLGDVAQVEVLTRSPLWIRLSDLCVLEQCFARLEKSERKSASDVGGGQRQRSVISARMDDRDDGKIAWRECEISPAA